MEIFQTIWTALTTENEWFTSLVCVPFSLVEASVTLYLAMVLLNLKFSDKKILTYILSLCTITNLGTFLLQ